MDSILIRAFYVLLPLFFALSVAPGADVHTARLFVLGIFATYIGMSLYRRNLYIPRGSIAYVAAGLLLLLSCSLFYSDVPSWSARKIFYIWTLAPIVFVAVGLLVHRRLTVENLVQSVVLGGAISSALIIFQFLLQFLVGLSALENLWHHIMPIFLGGTFSQSVISFNSWFVHIGSTDIFRGIGVFPDPHVAAFYTGMILPFACGLWSVTRRKRWLLVALIMLIANILTFSRGGEMGLLGGGFAAITLYWKVLSIRMRHTILALVAFIALALVIPGNSLSERFLSSFNAGDTSNSSRIEIWTEALDIWSDHPLLGVGLGAYPFAVDSDATYRTPIYAHNIFLDVTVELGLIGLVLFLILTARMGWAFLRARETFARCAIISVVILLTHGLFDTPFFSVHVFPIILLLIALAIHYEQIYKYQPEKG